MTAYDVAGDRNDVKYTKWISFMGTWLAAIGSAMSLMPIGVEENRSNSFCHWVLVF